MGNESDRLVFDYLSRVGDLAQRRQLPADERRALVAGLRDEIDRRRATRGEESPAAVRGILGALGTPDEVVGPAQDARGDWWGAEDDAPAAGAEPVRPTADPLPRPRRAAAAADVWWHDERGGDGFGDGDAGAELRALGFVGGVEAPEVFAPPPPEEPEAPAEAPPEPAGRARRLAGALLRRRRPGPAPEPEPEPEAPAGRRFGSPFLVLAAVLLLAGAAFGWLLALAAGWLLAYGSRRLSAGETKTAVFVLPGLAAAGGLVWLWGRLQGRWGEAVAAGGDATGAALADTWPWTLRAAAVSSALYLLWRARRA
ncbi:hypothetical protein [Streptomyces termitum]|uniref:hypothetical protein n=1 Tax=Streptomyces termitum TaxID=67368 RepID=UPI0037B224BE